MSRPQQILVVDDDPFIHRLVSARLHDLNVEIMEAFEGKTAIKLARSVRVDLILLDVNLPDVSGFEICAQLRDDPTTRDIPVLFLTGTDTSEEKVRAFEMGAVDYVTKPFNAAELRARVRAALRAQALMEALETQALSDPLTKLPNREAFRRSIAKRIEQVRQGEDQQFFALMFLDLDRFKIVNDSLGHAVGDQLLVEVANRLYACVQETGGASTQAASQGTNVIARLGGDEFGILVRNAQSHESTADLAQRVIDEVGMVYRLAGHELHCGVSIGIRMCDASCGSVDAILRDGDTAMYHAKAEGKGRFVFFSDDMHRQALERLQTEDQLRQATRGEELRVDYQPIVNLQTGLIEGLEALMRWQHAQWGMLGPEQFIPIAEETGLINEMGLWILERACRQAVEWNQRFGTRMAMHVNVSKAQFMSEAIASQFHAVLKETGLDAELLVVEITESVIMHDSRVVVPSLHKLRDLGVRLAMDDFGTGYSSLAALHRFPINILKIDREFVQRLSYSRPYAAIIDAIVALAHNLDLAVIAEGVETQDELVTLQSLNCDRAQGFLFGRPASASTIESLLFANQQERSFAA